MNFFLIYFLFNEIMFANSKEIFSNIVNKFLYFYRLITNYQNSFGSRDETLKF
jgi:hypothetical protein